MLRTTCGALLDQGALHYNPASPTVVRWTMTGILGSNYSFLE